MPVWALLAAAAASGSDAADARRILQRVNEIPYLRADSIEIGGQVCDGPYRGEVCDRPVRVEIERIDGSMRVTAVVEGAPTFTVDIPSRLVPDADLQDARFHGEYANGLRIYVGVPFGEPNQCFANDDGRSHLGVSFREDEAPRAWITSYPDCEVHDEQIVGEPVEE